MNIPTPYFEKVPIYGDLFFDHSIVEDIYLILFVLKNHSGQRFICNCCEIRDQQRWIMNPISSENLLDLLEDRLTLSDAFTMGDQFKIVAVRDYVTKSEIFYPRKASEIDQLDLPAPNEYLDAEDENDEYVKDLRLESYETYDGGIDMQDPDISIFVHHQSFSFSASLDELQLYDNYTFLQTA